MADTKISALSAASALGGTEVVPGVQSAANVGITVSQINDFTAGSDNDFTGTNSFSRVPNVSWSALAAGSSGAATINTQYYVSAFTSDTTITGYTGTPADGTRVCYLLIGCNGTASFAFPAAQRSGDATGTSTSITPTAGTHQVVFTYVNGAWYYSDDLADASATSPGGSDTYVQFNDSSAFGGVAGLTVNKTSGVLTQTQTSLGTTTASGFIARNTTAATVGAQQISPAIELEGQGWKTTATAASQSVRSRIVLLPVQGSTNPSGTLLFQKSIDGGAWATYLTLDIGGSITTTGSIFGSSSFTAGTSGSIAWNGRSIMSSPSNGVVRIGDNAGTDFGRLIFGGTSSSYPAIKRQSAGIDFVVGDDTAFTGTQDLYNRFGSGTPESVVTAPVGAVFHRTDGGAGTSFYVKESGAGNTGWVAK